MAIASVGQLINHQFRSASPSFNAPYTNSRSAGQLFVICYVADNAGITNGAAITNEVPALTCSAGNTYIKQFEYTYGTGARATGVQVAVFYSISTFAVTTANSVSLTYGENITAKTAIGWAFSYDTTKNLLFPTIDNASQSLPIYAGLANTTAPVQVINALNGDLMIRVCGVEASGVSFAQSAAWTSAGTIGTSGSGSALNVSNAVEFRIANATTNYSSEPSFGTADRVDYSFIIREQTSARRRYISIR